MLLHTQRISLKKTKYIGNVGHGEYGEIDSSGVYQSECVSFVRNMYKEAVGFTDAIPVPSGNNGKYNVDSTAGYSGSDFKLVAYNSLSDIKPGDILECYHHVMIFVGTVGSYNDVVANNGHNSPGELANGLMSFTKHYYHSSFHVYGEDAGDYHADAYPGESGCRYRVWRLTDEAAEKLGDKSSFNSGGDLVAAGKGGLGGGYTLLDMSDFYYNGIPDGKYSVTKGFFEKLIDNLGQIFDFIVGLLTMMTRMVFVGWTAIIEKLINYTVKSISGGGSLESTPVSATEVDSGEYISLEKIIFNQIGIFDVNFFNFNDEDPSLSP